MKAPIKFSNELHWMWLVNEIQQSGIIFDLYKYEIKFETVVK